MSGTATLSRRSLLQSGCADCQFRARSRRQRPGTEWRSGAGCRQLPRHRSGWLGGDLYQQGRRGNRPRHGIPPDRGRGIGYPGGALPRDRGRYRDHAESRRHGRQFGNSARRGRYSPGGGHCPAGVARTGREASGPAGGGTQYCGGRSQDSRRHAAGFRGGADWRPKVFAAGESRRAAQEPRHLYSSGQADSARRCAGEVYRTPRLSAGSHGARHAARARGAAPGFRGQAGERG